MSDNELLLAISDIIRKNTKVLERRIDRVGDSLNKRIDALETSNMMILDKIENVIEPRLNTIESCYTSTYVRYRDSVDKIETLEMNMAVVQSVFKEYGERLEPFFV